MANDYQIIGMKRVQLTDAEQDELVEKIKEAQTLSKKKSLS